MSDAVVDTTPLARPNLKPRWSLFLAALALFLAWMGVLLALYFRAARG